MIHPIRDTFASLARRVLGLFALVIAAVFGTVSAQAQSDFITFESGHVRPIALTPDGNTLLAVNTPDNHLEVFSVSGGSLTHTDSIPVGMEPVSVAARSDSEVWVVNHLSDSVSIIDLTATPARVVRTLLVGDEPRDIVFAGTGETADRAFITTAHRGQHRSHPSISGVIGAGDPQLTTSGVPRADVWVFDATELGTTVGGTPVQILSFFADTPRALAVTPDLNTVYVAAFQSGNQTTVINETLVCDGFDSANSCEKGDSPGGVPGPDDNAGGTPAPETGVIVKFNGSAWLDADGKDWSDQVPFSLPDHDVFSINANSLASNSIVEFDHVGTILFNMVVNPVTGKVYVTNTELPNHIRFEGPGNHGGSTVQGHLSESRITVLTPGGGVDPQHLNQHIDYNQLHTDGGANHAAIEAQKDHSLATPVQPVVNAAGDTIYMAAFGSARIGVFSASDIEDANFEANFDPSAESLKYIDTGGGPSGLVLDEANNRLYVLTRFANQVEVYDLATDTREDTHKLHNPEPAHVVTGRKFLYDANLTSGNGEPSCSSCHIFGDMDQLAWNLGDPDGGIGTNNQPSATPLLPPGQTFHPMKGPMTTQTLRGMGSHGSLHWRGDRVDGFFGTDDCLQNPNVTAPCDEELGFRNFIVAFEGLVGMHGTITANQMQQFTDFALDIMLPPNPVRALDNDLSSAALSGSNLFFGQTTDQVENCNGCHNTDPSKGFFGTGGSQSFEGEPQTFKVAHMRNLYHKIGMFQQSGDQVRGFGFLHDGSIDSVQTFLTEGPFSLDGAQVNQLEQFSLEFPTDLAPMVGQQVTLTGSNGGVVNSRIDLMIARAGTTYDSLMVGGAVPECDLIVKGSIGGEKRGAVRLASGQFQSDKASDPLATDAQIRNLANSDGPITYTCVPPGSGERMGINRDRDNHLDGDDNCPDIANNNQADEDADGIGNLCDPDYVAPPPPGCGG